MRKFIIGVTNRSGSTWLCSMLNSTGLLGYSAEFLNLAPAVWSRFAEHYPALLRQYPLIGIKCACGDLQRAIDIIGDAEFRGIPCVWLRRKDVLAQAISNYRAWKSSRWHRSRGDAAVQPDVPFNRAEILTFYRQYMQANTVGWPELFRTLEVAPLEVWYEEMCRAPQETVIRICGHFGVGRPRIIDVAAFEIMRDEARDAEWRKLFSAEELALAASSNQY